MQISHGIAGFLLFFVLAAAAGEVYRWVDDQGRVHFGDRPAGAAGASRVELPATPPADAAPDTDGALSRERLLRYYDEKRAEERDAEVQARQEREARALRCEEARRLLARYESVGRIFQTGEDGQRRYLSADERDQLLATLREEVARWCEG